MFVALQGKLDIGVRIQDLGNDLGKLEALLIKL